MVLVQKNYAKDHHDMYGKRTRNVNNYTNKPFKVRTIKYAEHVHVTLSSDLLISLRKKIDK